MKFNKLHFLFLLLIAMMFPGCGVIEGIFKAGFLTAIIIIVIIVALIIYLIKKLL